MNLRAYFASKIPALSVPTQITDAQIQAVLSEGIIHRWFVGADAAWGQIGARVPCTTISGRTALDLIGGKRLGSVEHFAPFWSLWLGAMLESSFGIPFITWLPFVSYPGHLQDAIVSDLARQVSGIQYFTGIRVLGPKS